MQADWEIRRWVWRLQWRVFFSRGLRSILTVFATTLFVHASVTFLLVHFNYWIPTPSQMLSSAFWVSLTAAAITFVFAIPVSREHFLRDLDHKLKWGDKLITWSDLNTKSGASPLFFVFLHQLKQDLAAVDFSGWFKPIRSRWQDYAVLIAAFLYILLLLPWGGGLAAKLKEQSQEAQQQIHNKESVVAAKQGAEGQESPAPVPNPKKPKDQNDQQLPAPEKKPPPKKFEIVPKFVAAAKKEGPTSLKDIFIYDIPTQLPSESSAVESQTPLSQKYPEFRKLAEEWVQRENFDPEEKDFVIRYFEKIRP